MPAIRKGDLLTTAQERQINAALALAGKTRKDFATEKDVSYQRLNRMVRGEEVVTESYAKLLRSLLKTARSAFSAQAA